MKLPLLMPRFKRRGPRPRPRPPRPLLREKAGGQKQGKAVQEVQGHTAGSHDEAFNSEIKFEGLQLPPQASHNALDAKRRGAVHAAAQAACAHPSWESRARRELMPAPLILPNAGPFRPMVLF